MENDNAYWGGPSTWERSRIDDRRKAAAHLRALADKDSQPGTLKAAGEITQEE